MYQALYRKWRPQTFDQVLGQGHITETLKNQVKTGRLSHAYIFIGTRGTGKTTCARILAKAVNCESPVNGNPCCRCPACLGIAEGSFMDIVELDAASNNGVDNVRALREEAVFSPVNLKKRVYIIDEVHMLSTAAFNALLKILEEPPKHLMFILATTELHKVPATILSRCQRHSFRRIDSASIAGYLSQVADKEGMKLKTEAAELIARLAEGGVRDALSLLDQCSGRGEIDLETVYSSMGLAGKRRVARMLENIMRRDAATAVNDFNSLWMDGKDPQSFLEELSALMRDVLMLKVAPRSASDLLSGGYELDSLRLFARNMTTEELICGMNKLQRALSGMRDTKNTKTAAELCLISLCAAEGGDSVEELKARISVLEASLENGFAALRFEKADHQMYVAEELGSGEREEYCSRRHEYEEEEEEYSLTTRRAERESEYEEDELDTDSFAEEQPEDAFLHKSPVHDEEEDGIEPDVFTEEQPEDAFLQRGRAGGGERHSPENVQSAAESRPDEPTESAGDNEALWQQVKVRLEDKLAYPLPLSLKDGRIVGSIENGQLYLKCVEGFLPERLKRPNIMEQIKQIVKEVCGRELRVQVLLLEEKRSTRDIEELRAFKEVKFI